MRAAAAAASCGFQRTMVLEGGLQALGGGSTQLPQPQADLRFIGRDALAVLLGMSPEVLHVPAVTLVDVRRSDERALYGAIKGAAHIPGAWGAAGLAGLLVGHKCVPAAAVHQGTSPASRHAQPPTACTAPLSLQLISWPARWRCRRSSSLCSTALPSRRPTTWWSSPVSCCACADAAVVCLHGLRACCLFNRHVDARALALACLTQAAGCEPLPTPSPNPYHHHPPIRRPHQHAGRVGSTGGARCGPAALPGAAAGRVWLAAGPRGEAVPRLPPAGCAARGGAVYC